MSERSLVVRISVGDGATCAIPDPSKYHDGGLAWCLTYHKTDSKPTRQAVSVIDTFDYLLGMTNQKQAFERLRILRREYRRLSAAPRFGDEP